MPATVHVSVPTHAIMQVVLGHSLWKPLWDARRLISALDNQMEGVAMVGMRNASAALALRERFPEMVRAIVAFPRATVSARHARRAIRSIRQQFGEELWLPDAHVPGELVRESVDVYTVDVLSVLTGRRLGRDGYSLTNAALLRRRMSGMDLSPAPEWTRPLPSEWTLARMEIVRQYPSMRQYVRMSEVPRRSSAFSGWLEEQGLARITMVAQYVREVARIIVPTPLVLEGPPLSAVPDEEIPDHFMLGVV